MWIGAQIVLELRPSKRRYHVWSRFAEARIENHISTDDSDCVGQRSSNVRYKSKSESVGARTIYRYVLVTSTLSAFHKWPPAKFIWRYKVPRKPERPANSKDLFSLIYEDDDVNE